MSKKRVNVAEFVNLCDHSENFEDVAEKLGLVPATVQHRYHKVNRQYPGIFRKKLGTKKAAPLDTLEELAKIRGITKDDLKKEMEKTRDVGELIKKTMIKEHGKDISAMIPRLVKDPSKVPEIILDQKKELNILKENLKMIKEEFQTDQIAVLKAEESQETKAKQAMPGKPAIFLIK